MTDNAYKIKTWLERLFILSDDTQKLKNLVLSIEDKLNNTVTNYENTGAGAVDRIVKTQNRENLIFYYTEARAKYEQALYKLCFEDVITIIFLDNIKNTNHRALLLDRYIRRLSWQTIINSKKYDYSKRRLFGIHRAALEELAKHENEINNAINEAKKHALKCGQLYGVNPDHKPRPDHPRKPRKQQKND